MVLAVQLRTTNCPFLPDLLIIQELSSTLYLHCLKNQYPEVHRNRFSHSSYTAL